MNEHNPLLWFALLATVLSITATVIVAPLISALIRRRIAVSMNEAAQRTPAGDADREIAPDLKPATARRLRRVASSAALDLRVDGAQHLQAARRRNRCLAVAHGAGGLACATILTALFALGQRVSFNSLTALALTCVFALPVVPIAARLLSARLSTMLICAGAAVLLSLLLAGQRTALLWDVMALHLLVPALILLIFSLRYWRTVAPLMLVLAMLGALGWLLGAQLGKSLAASALLMSTLRVAGAGLGVACALPVARKLGVLYRDGAIGDQELAIDTWWTIYMLFQMVVFLATRPHPHLIVGGVLAAWCAYWLIKRRLELHLCSSAEPPVRLLLLRVFAHDSRAEQLLDELALRWRPIGTVTLIAGPDLAFRVIDPQDLYLFLTGALARAFVTDAGDLERRLAVLNERRDSDGGFRVTPFYCHRDTWKMVFEKLAQRCDAVLMDLRGFDHSRLGCQHEVARLGAMIGHKPIVLLMDDDTHIDLIDSLFERHALQPSAPAPGPGAFLLHAGGGDSATLAAAVRLLLGAEPREPAVPRLRRR